MSKLWPFADKSKELAYQLKAELKSLKDKIEEEDDLEGQLKQLELKVYNESDSTPILGTFGVVDEYFDKGMLQRLFCTETWFYIAVNAIATDIAGLPIKLEKRKVTTQSVAQHDGNSDKVRKETWIDASGEPEFKILNKPNNIQTAVEFWMLVIIDLLATGDTYIFVDQGKLEDQQLEDDNEIRNRLRQSINRSKPCRVRGMYRLSSSLVTPVASTEDNKILEGYSLQTDGGNFTFGVDEVIHIRLANPSDPFFGLSPIIPVMKKLLLDRYTDEHMLRFYKQGARLGGVIKSNKKLTKDQLIRLERVFENNFTGKRNHHKTLVLPEGMEYQTIEQNPGETALIEFTKANKEPILAAFKVPPVKVGLLDGATYANANIQDKTYYQNTIKPLLTLVEQAINGSGIVFPPLKELKMSFDLSGIESLKENEVEKTTIAKGMLDSGLSVNEVREKVWKVAPAKGGDKIPVIEKLDKPAFTPFANLSAPKGDVKTEVLNTQNDTQTLSDIKPTNITFDQRVSEIAAVAIQNGIDPSLAIPQAIQQALIEGFVPSSEVSGNEKKWGRFSKSEVEDYIQKTVGSGVAPLIEDYQKSVEELFDRMEVFFLKEFKKTKSINRLKIKAGNDGIEDVEFISDHDIEVFVNGEKERYTKDQWAAMRKGYNNSFSSTPLTFPNERAKKKLEEVGTQHLKSITGTARDRAKRVIIESYNNQDSVSEVASKLRDEFKAMKAGKANTIARTETLTAVSMGQREKAEEMKKAFPSKVKQMKKVWASAEDDRVRDSHAALDGVAIPIDEKFDNGLMYARDPEGEAGEIINCRCTTIEYFEDDEAEIMSTLSDTSPLAESVEEAEKSLSKINRHEGETYDDCVSRGIVALINEGKSPEQAAAMTYSMCEIKSEKKYKLQKKVNSLLLKKLELILKGGPGSGRRSEGPTIPHEEINSVSHTFGDLSKALGAAGSTTNIEGQIGAAQKSGRMLALIESDSKATPSTVMNIRGAHDACQVALKNFVFQAQQFDSAKTFEEKDKMMPAYVQSYKNLSRTVDELEKISNTYRAELKNRI